MTSRFAVLLCRIKCYLIKGLNLPPSSTSWYFLLKWLYVSCLTMFSSFPIKVTTFSILKILSLSAKIINTKICIYNLCYLRGRKKFRYDGYVRTGMYPLLLGEVAPTDHGIWEKQILSITSFAGFVTGQHYTDVPLVEFMHLVFTCMPDESYCRQLRSLLLCVHDVFWALINSLVCWFYMDVMVDLVEILKSCPQVLWLKQRQIQIGAHGDGDVVH